MRRREFLKLAGATAVCACTGGVGVGGCSSAGVPSAPLAPEGSYRRAGERVILSLTAVDELQAVGGAVRLALGDDEDSEVKILLVHPEDDVYRAFANRCTHRGKELNYLHEEKELRCRSRKARFDVEGHVIKGPAEGPLLVYPSRREGDELVIEIS
jgi:nitrite reductase/ring-hydroxylating ferredoxin subunit